MNLELKGKKVILTGGSRGIGRATLDLFADAGADIGFFSRNAAQVEQASAQLRDKGVNVIAQALDMSDTAAYKAWLTSTAEALGGVDIFVHNASAAGGLGSEEHWYNCFELDLMGAVRGCETLEPYLKKSSSPAVVMLGSTAATETFLAPQAFNALKASLITYAKQLGQHWAASGIRVNCVSPGPTYFEGGNWSLVETHMKPLFDSIQAQQPSGRFGNPQEIARAIVFLASPASSYTNGTNLVVDGGFTKRVQF
ncbi:SDR family NAD(P)-dependent oxidoreductase [Pseudomonas umsongensis]|uniref:SDR family NAD(P)-dependent oxidoreductase n=1 Tax=Pseudomonas umsongensis TaxID=198618 RepID=UPI00200B1E33|nr:SDR family oxidoreductase [Pseudomonas umsongensis]MCK8683286.1 SDR family oxidoreductase [Pseudomonas umsongensis]